MPDFQEPKCKDCESLGRDVQFEEWDCEHVGRPAGKSTVNPRDPVAPEWCPLRSKTGVEMGRRGQLEDMMGYLADAGSALERARIAAENARHPEAGEFIERHRRELLVMREAFAEAEGLEV
jgi:hypothetical protein